MATTIGPGITVGAGVAVTPEPASVVTTGLMLSLDAGDPASYPGSGTTWTDTVSSIPFTLQSGAPGGVTYSSDDGGYLEFVTGSDQWASSSTSLASLSTWTVEAWHYPSGSYTGSNPCLVTETYVGGDINYTLGYPNGAPNFQAGFWNGSWQTTPSGYTLSPYDAWYQIVGTYDGTTIKLYVNNTLINQTAYTFTPTSSGAGIRLMNRWDNADYWGGRLSIVRIYDDALTAEQVTQNYNADRSRFGL
jgi:hypothetical protein